MSSTASNSPRREASRVGGARADFVAQLGRRVAELRQSVALVQAEPTNAKARDELRRRMHALASAAKILKFQGMAERLAAGEAQLTRAAERGAVGGEVLAQLGRDIDELPTLAWGELADEEAVARKSSEPPPPAEPRLELSWPSTALVIGDESLAEAVMPESPGSAAQMLECERTGSTRTALDMARALAPDVVLLDADLPGAEPLARKLIDDPLTQPVPLVVVGSFASPDVASRWVALGAARVLAKPASPSAIHDACVGVMGETHRAPRPEPLGTLTVEQLADRLADELRRGLCDAVSAEARTLPIDLGDGHDMLAALWSAVARIREMSTIRSMGTVRFSPVGPEGALPIASWSADARAGGARGGIEPPTAEARLDGRTVVVADDDPAVTWFLSGVLRAAGAQVLEAHDGEAALALSCRAAPDLIISDILMPKLDGFALCRVLKRDVALRDVPVILLSWKEDLLQRVRELGAEADGYLRKEASASVVLQRVREVLRGRTRVESRLSAGGEVRGRLDDLTVHTLLKLVGRKRPDARVSIRDASFLYEIELRDGAPRAATRTAQDGSFERGRAVLAAVLGVGAGRFVMDDSVGAVRGIPLEGTLDEQLRPSIARARAAQKLLSGSALLEVHGVDINLYAIQPYFVASPLSSRSVLDKLAEGLSPRALLLRGGVPARLLEDVLSDAAGHGAILYIFDGDGRDVLGNAAARELLLLERGVTNGSIIPAVPPPLAIYAEPTPSPLQPLPEHTAAPLAMVARRESPLRSEHPLESAPPAPPIAPPPSTIRSNTPAPPQDLPSAAAPAEPVLTQSPSIRPEEPAPESVWEQLPEAAFASGDVSPSCPQPVEILPPPRSSPLPDESSILPDASSRPVLASEPELGEEVDDEPVLIEDEAPAPEPALASELPAHAAMPPVAPASAKDESSPATVQPSLPEPPSVPGMGRAPAPPSVAAVVDPPEPVLRASITQPLFVGRPAENPIPPGANTTSPQPPPDLPAPPQAEAPAEQASAKPTADTSARPLHDILAALLTTLLAAVTVGGWWAGKSPEVASLTAGTPLAYLLPAARVPAAPGTDDLPLPDGASVPDGEGMLEIVAEQKAEIVVDQTDRGEGPALTLTVPSGTHDIRMRRGGDEKPVTVAVRSGRRTRVDMRAAKAD